MLAVVDVHHVSNHFTAVSPPHVLKENLFDIIDADCSFVHTCPTLSTQ